MRTDGAALAQQFELRDVPDLEPRYNIAPTQDVAVVRQETDGRRLALLRWGLVPSWAKDLAMGARLINARAETAAEKPSFRAAFKYRRCLVLADGFYEWQASGKGRHKQPFYILRQDEQPFGFAGLWEYWEGDDGSGDPSGRLESCTILTTTPNDLLRPIHDRMPVILHPDQYALWLDPTVQQREPLEALLQPCPAELLQAYPVSRAVNNARHNSPECIAPETA